MPSVFGEMFTYIGLASAISMTVGERSETTVIQDYLCPSDIMEITVFSIFSTSSFSTRSVLSFSYNNDYLIVAIGFNIL